MKNFIIRFCLFSLPLAVAVTLCLGYLSSHREFYSHEAMARKNQNDHALIGLAHSDSMRHVKQEVLKSRTPRVIALGTSRVLSFRDFYFGEPQAFYNCGRSVGKIMDLQVFLNSYPAEFPEVIILGLDQDFFMENWDERSKVGRNYELNTSTIGRFVKLSKALLKDLTKNRLTFDGANDLTKEFVGATARIHHEGYRSDGSYLYGKWIGGDEEIDNYQFETTLKRIEKKSKVFAASIEINEDAVSELGDFLDLCAEKEIHVVTFLPPYAHKVIERFAEEAGEYPHIFKLYERISPLFEHRGLLLFDFSDIASVGCNDYETIDGFHGSETCYLKIIHRMALKDRTLAQHLDVAQMEQLLQSLYSARQIIFEIDEMGRQKAN